MNDYTFVLHFTDGSSETITQAAASRFIAEMILTDEFYPQWLDYIPVAD